MDSRMKTFGEQGLIHLGLALWIAAAPMLAWLMLWFLSGEFLASLLAVVCPLALLAAPVK